MKILVQVLNGALRLSDIKRAWVLISILFFSISCFSQQPRKGKILEQKILSKSVEGNPGGEDPSRSVTIYLPPGYDAGDQRYPVIYFLHGFGADDKRVISETHINDLMDTAIVIGLIRPAIIVMPAVGRISGGAFIPIPPLWAIGLTSSVRISWSMSIKIFDQFPTETAGVWSGIQWGDMAR